MFFSPPTFDRTDGVLIESFHGTDHIVEVHQNRKFRWLQFENEITQSAMWLRKPTRLILPYTQSMLTPLLFCPPPQRVLLLGLGGGSLLRHFLTYHPLVAIDVVERSGQVIAAARKYFEVSPQQPIFEEDARDFLRRAGKPYDLILVDVFDRTGMPQWLVDDGFMRICSQRLEPSGALGINTMPENKEDLGKLLMQLRALCNRHVLSATLRRYRNVMLFGFAQKPPIYHLDDLGRVARQLERAQSIPFRSILKNLRVSNRIVRREFFDYELN